MAEISRQPRPGGRVAQSTTEATANADGEPAGTAASYTADGENVPGGAATIASRASTIAFDGSAGTGELLPGPADLLAAALAACILKNVERCRALDASGNAEGWSRVRERVPERRALPHPLSSTASRSSPMRLSTCHGTIPARAAS